MNRRRPILRSILGGCALLGLLAALAPQTAAAQRYRRPVACDNCINYWYYLDEGGTRDWNCGNATYSGHLGSDYSLRGGNASISAGNAVVAMAAGTVMSSQDGFYDRCTQCGGSNCGYDFGNGFANQVIIDHGAYTVIYGHMRMGSIKVMPGAQVTCGMTIGEIGSSGCSTGAHLHIEPRMAGAPEPTDPYIGDCSPTQTSLWVDQSAYRTMPSPTCDGEDPVPVCPADTFAIWTCNTALTERRRCEAGVDTKEPCPYGCVAMPQGTDDICMLPPDADADGSRADVDCKDNDRAIHPGAVDVCGDGIDQDCSGRDLSCTPPGAGSGGAGGGAGAGAPAAGGGGGAAASGAGGGAGQAGTLSQAAGQNAARPGGQGGAAGAAGASAGSTGVAGVGPGGGAAQGGLLAPAAGSDGCAVSRPAARTPGFFPSALGLAALLARARRRRPARPR